MQRPLLPARERAIAGIATLREPAPAPSLKLSDPAVRAMIDFRHDPAPVIAEELTVEQALDEMFRVGVRAFLVVRAGTVTGLITAQAARRARSRYAAGVLAGTAGALAVSGAARAVAPVAAPLRVADVMTASEDVPAIDWEILEEAQVRDLVEIFEGSGAHQLLVLENAAPTLVSLRGIIHRERLERQLGAGGFIRRSTAVRGDA